MRIPHQKSKHTPNKATHTTQKTEKKSLQVSCLTDIPSTSPMAAVLECVSVPRASVSPAFLPAKVSTASVSLISARRRWPECKGLKVVPTRSFGSVSYSQRASLKFGRGGRIVCEAQETAVDVPAVSDSTWQSLVLESELPVLVEFWAPWCGPCRMIHPVIDELSKEYAGKLKCYKVNTDESPSVATRYGIRSIPTVIIFKNGDKKDTVIGAVPKSTLTTSIDKFL